MEVDIISYHLLNKSNEKEVNRWVEPTFNLSLKF